MLNTKKIGLAVLLLSALVFQITAQKVHLTAVSFGGECAGTKNAFSNRLRSLIRKQRNGRNYEDCLSSNEMCEKSFAFDLNGDKRREYFVRLGCGATGNCTYGIFADRPARLLGTVTAWFFWIDKPSGSWSKIKTYEREGGDQGYIQSYAFRLGKYRTTDGSTERFNSTKKSFAEKMGMPDCTTN
jgi:hypothetical protein